MRLLLQVSVFVFFIQANSQMLQHISFGSHQVGFSSLLEFDYSRPARIKDQFGRTIQINVWYPALAGRSKQMDIKEYLFLGGREDSIVSDKDANENILKQFIVSASSRGADSNAWKSYFNSKQPMTAKQNAIFKKGAYPVILLMHGSAFQYALIGEFLASYGMVVINVPYKGYLQTAFDVNVIGMETEIRDLEFALHIIIKKLSIKPLIAGAVGISFGGQSAIGLAVRNPIVKAVVSLDGGIGSVFGHQLLSGYPFYSIDKVTMPILHIYNPKDPGGNIDWFDVSKYNSRYLLALNNMDHQFFGIYGWLDRYIPSVLGKSMPRPGNNTEILLQSTLNFFQMVFSNAADESLALGRKYSWMVPSIASEEFRQKEYITLPDDFLMEIFNTRGVEGVKEIHKKQQAITVMPVSAKSYNILFLYLFNKQDKNAVLEIAEMYRRDFPRSALAAYYLARAQQLNDRMEYAKKSFNDCLALLPSDNALKEFEKETYKTRCENFLK